MNASPSLGALRAFECVARHGNFTRAGVELRTSQSAVSRQIAALESHFGLPLCRRERTGVSLTADGQALFRELSEAFRLISAATQKLTQRHRERPVRIRTYTTFMAKWLIHRLPRFQEQYPDLEVLLSSGLMPGDFEDAEIDLSIQFGDGQWAGMSAELLFHDEIDVVCCPALLQRQPLRALDDLKNHRLLHARYRRSDWDDWLVAAGRADLRQTTGDMVFSSSLLNYQAAIDGLGVSIGQIHLLRHDLATGQLIRPFNKPLRRELAYYLVKPRGSMSRAAVDTFETWLRLQILNMKDERP